MRKSIVHDLTAVLESHKQQLLKELGAASKDLSTKAKEEINV
jgi:hypothetical protein